MKTVSAGPDGDCSARIRHTLVSVDNTVADSTAEESLQELPDNIDNDDGDDDDDDDDGKDDEGDGERGEGDDNDCGVDLMTMGMTMRMMVMAVVPVSRRI
eukprot:5614334-Karenia_brevis.AAC.1